MSNNAQQRLVVLISSKQPLFTRLSDHLAELPHSLIVRREDEEHSEWLNRSIPWIELGQSRIRKEWKYIEEALDQGKTPVSYEIGQTSLSRDRASMSVYIPNARGGKVPVLIRTTFHPNWVRLDGQRVYPVTPFFMLTFASEPFELRFRRTAVEWAAVIVSASSFLALFLALIGLNRFNRKRSSLSPSQTH